MRFADCHPNRKHHAKGMCRSCYAKSLPKKTGPDRKVSATTKSKNQRRSTAWRKAEDNKARAKDARYKREYGITLAEVEAMKIAQKFRCAICNIKTESFHVDHHHESNTVRGLLCGSCNRGIGLLQECTTIMLAAVKYLLYWSTRYDRKTNV